MMVDLTRGLDGVLRAQLLDMAVGRSGTAYKTWLDAQAPAFRAWVKHAALDPFRGYAKALREGLGGVVAVLDAFHVVKLGTQVMDEARRRVQQDTLHRRGHREDPLYKIGGLVRHGAENLSERHIAPPGRGPGRGRPGRRGDRGLAVLPAIALDLPRHPPRHREGDRREGHRILALPARSPKSPARAARYPWRVQVLAYFDTGGLSTGGTEVRTVAGERSVTGAFRASKMVRRFRRQVIHMRAGLSTSDRLLPDPRFDDVAAGSTMCL